MNNERKISVTEYAHSRNITRQAVLKRLYPVFKEMPGIIRAEKIGKTWILITNK